MTEPQAGWAWPLNSRKAHFFVDGRSLCRRWGFFGSNYNDNQRMGAEPGPDDCKACWRKAKARQDEHDDHDVEPDMPGVIFG